MFNVAIVNYRANEYRVRWLCGSALELGQAVVRTEVILLTC